MVKTVSRYFAPVEEIFFPTSATSAISRPAITYSSSCDFFDFFAFFAFLCLLIVSTGGESSGSDVWYWAFDDDPRSLSVSDDIVW